MLSRLRLSSRVWRHSGHRLVCNIPGGGEERDLVNFPKLVRAEGPGPVRYGVIPEEWFAFFYDKTGVTGPYVLFVSVSTYLISKEIWVLEHNFYNGLSMIALCAILVKKLGPGVAAFLDESIDAETNAWNTSMSDAKKYYEDQIAKEKLMQWSADGELMLMAAKRENVAIQLEAEYRIRLWRVYNAVMRLLNCALDKAATEKRFHHRYLVQWVVAEVTKSITPETNKQFIRLCIEEIARLANVK